MRLLSLLWIGLLLCTINLSAQTTWTGAIDTDWFNAANWSAGLPSSINTPATLPAAPTGGNFPTISSPTIINYDISNFGQLTIGSDVNFQSATFQNLGPTGMFIVNSAGNFIVDNAGVFSNFNIVENNNIIENNGNFINASQVTNLGTLTNNNIYTNGFGAAFDNGNAAQAGTVINLSLIHI